MVIRLLAVLLMIVGVYLCFGRAPADVAILRSTGAFERLVAGTLVSSQWSDMLMVCLRRCAALYSRTHTAPVHQTTLDELVLESQRAEACVNEMLSQAPNVPTLLAALEEGRHDMNLQLRAWQTEARVRCGLLDRREYHTDVSA